MKRRSRSISRITLATKANTNKSSSFIKFPKTWIWGDSTNTHHRTMRAWKHGVFGKGISNTNPGVISQPRGDEMSPPARPKNSEWCGAGLPKAELGMWFSPRQACSSYRFVGFADAFSLNPKTLAACPPIECCLLHSKPDNNR